MLTLYYTPGACSMAAHIVLEESGEEYEAKKVDLAGGEQRTEASLKINPLGRLPALLLDNGEPLAENTAILPFLGKRFDLWPENALPKRRHYRSSASLRAACMWHSPMSADLSGIRPIRLPSPPSKTRASRLFTAI
jgi:glutathione S-transferase